MKSLLQYFSLFLICLAISCAKNKKKSDIAETEKEEVIKAPSLPFTNIDLNNLSAFNSASDNWTIVENAVADRKKQRTFSFTEGTGVLLNTPNDESKNNLFTNFEHGDIELELDVMMPLESNSGIYFQSRYEIQLLDSWGVEKPKYSDIGGIYQRWNKDAVKGKEGYEGHAPRVNATKAPGLWQHLKVIFHAPRFDTNGSKIKNAWFEEVRLNNVLLHENIEVTGSTRAAAFGDEKSLAPIMIQGDHGPVAFKNIKYKLYDGKGIGIENTALKIYDNPKGIRVIENLDSLKLVEEHKTDSISPLMRIDQRDQKTLSYVGTLNIPHSGNYLFDATVNGGTYLIINNDTIINMNQDFNLNTTKYGKVHLEKGSVPYQLVYNKPVVWKRGFDFFVEGPKMQRYSFLKTGTTSLNKQNPINPITLKVTNKTLTQRSFLNHKGVKRSHCISVGLVEKLNYSLDLETGTLLHVWSGGFLDATQMWHSRGEHQRGDPMGFSVSSHGDLDFAFLENKDAIWPKALNENIAIKQLGYEFKADGFPEFSFEINGSKISHRLETSSNSKRGLDRIINSNSESSIWHKIADGESIKALSKNTFIINNESYYIVFPENNTLKPVLRNNSGKDELLIEIPKGAQSLKYSIIW